MPGGILFGSDWDRLCDSVRRVIDRFPEEPSVINFVEIGVLDGRTSRDLFSEIRQYCQECKNTFHYYGIDAFFDFSGIPDNRYTFIKGMSYEVLGQLPSQLHWVFVDGCHCAQCVRRDLESYAPLLADGGEMVFHDAAPLEQFKGGGSSWHGDHHDRVKADKGTDVRSVLDSVMVNRPDFTLVLPAQTEQTMGGVEVYRKKGT